MQYHSVEESQEIRKRVNNAKRRDGNDIQEGQHEIKSDSFHNYKKGPRLAVVT